MNTSNSENWHYSSTAISKQEKRAVEAALEKGYWPTEPYKGMREPWEVTCLECNSTIKTTYGKLIQKSFKCDVCNPNFYSQEIELMLKANLKPLEPYSGNSGKLWKSQCMLCGLECYPRYYDVSVRGKGGCKPCGSKSNQTPEFLEEIKRMMTEANLEPLEPYKNSMHKWLCRCLSCGEKVTPTAHNIKAGHGGCVFCQVAAFKHNESAYLYLIHHKEYSAFKVGIGNDKTVKDRIESHIKSGWTLLVKYSFTKGNEAFKVEKTILEWVRKEKGLAPYLTNEYFKHGGASETFSDESITALEIKNKMKETIKGLKDQIG